MYVGIYIVPKSREKRFDSLKEKGEQSLKRIQKIILFGLWSIIFNQ